MRSIIILILLISIYPYFANSQDSITANNTKFQEGICAPLTWNKPFWADMHSTIINGEVAFAKNSPEYDYGKNGGFYRPYMYANVGADLPVWTGNFKNKKFGFGFYIPIFFNVWLDMFERSTAPVINTSYRYGMPEFTFIHRFDKSYFGIKNYSVKFAPMKHECTHLGDELTIARRLEGFVLTRVNVSHDYFEFGATINDPENMKYQNHGFKLGGLLLHNFKRGWYNIAANEGDTTVVKSTTVPYELYFQYQYQSNTFKKSNLQFIGSVELRNRVQYNYPFYAYTYDDDIIKEKGREKMTWNINAMIGFRYNNPKYMGQHRIGFGLRGYYGITPYGQFRNLPDYYQFGFMLMFE